MKSRGKNIWNSTRSHWNRWRTTWFGWAIWWSWYYKTESNTWKKSKVEEKLVQAQNLRNASLETFGQIRKRKENDAGEGSQKRSCRSTSNDIIFTSHIFLRNMKGKCHCVRSEIKKKKSLIYRLNKPNRNNRLSKLNSCLFSSKVQSS